MINEHFIFVKSRTCFLIVDRCEGNNDTYTVRMHEHLKAIKNIINFQKHKNILGVLS